MEIVVRKLWFAPYWRFRLKIKNFFYDSCRYANRFYSARFFLLGMLAFF